MQTSRLVLVAVIYLLCILGALLLLPGPISTSLVAYTFAVWLGGVMFLVLYRQVDFLRNDKEDR